MRTLIVAAGGGGDAITGAALAGPLRLADQPVVMTYSWDRLMIDPLPGPRIAADFTGLRQLAAHVLEVVPSTEPIAPAGSALPRLAAELPARVLLLDPAGGAVSMAMQINAAAAFFNLDDVALTDVRGDVAPGRTVFMWHPSEAPGLLATAVNGRRGRVEVRDAGDHVELTDTTTGLFAVGANQAVATTPALNLTESTSLAEAERIVRDLAGISEITYETQKAARLRRRRAHTPTAADLPAIDRHADAARARGAEFISVRRISELLGSTTLAGFGALAGLLAAERPNRYEPSLYGTDPTP